MKGLLKKLENVYSAAAFAEAGEIETARELLCEEAPLHKRIGKRVDREYASKIAVKPISRHK